VTTDTALGPAETPTGASPRAVLLRRVVLGPPDDPRWVRPGLWAVLILAGLLYGWNLSSLGDANDFYAAAIYSGTKSWSAFFFGSLDAGNYITVDKPPGALWVMGISARIFGYSTVSMLLPQVLCGIGAVAMLYATVRRACMDLLGRSGSAAASLLAALVLTLTPITVAINRDNNPDTVLVLLLVLAAWALQRSVENGRLRWLLLSMVFVGCAFNTKMLQAFIVLPGFYLVYLLFAGRTWWRRILDLTAATAVLAVASGWWMVVVDLIPASKRPYIGGSTDGTVWDLVVGYNGLGRIQGEGGGPGGGFGGASGLGRMFNDVVGGQISWLLPFAALALVAGIVLIGRRPRTDLARAGLCLWAGWLAMTFVVFSFAEGTFHPYYTTALAPAIGGVVGIGTVLMFRAGRLLAWTLPLGIAITGIWSFTILRRTPDWHPPLAWAVLTVSLLGAAVLLIARLAPANRRRLAAVAAVVGFAGALSGPAAYALSPLSSSSAMGGSNPTAGPSTSTFPGAGGGTRMRGTFPGGRPGTFPAPNGNQAPRSQVPGGTMQGGGPGGGGFGGRDGSVSSQLVRYLEKNQGGATWLVAVSSSMSAAPLILETGKPVIAMGGFTGSDPAMTVAKLQQYIKQGKLKFVMTGGAMGNRDGATSAVTSWVQKNCTAITPTTYGSSSSTTSLYSCTT